MSHLELALEKARVRDLLRYYTPQETSTKKLLSLLAPDCPDPDSVLLLGDDGAQTQITAAAGAHDGPAASADNVATPTVLLDHGEDEIPEDSSLLAHDPTLVAFTQLGAFRTNCERSFISLMDGKKQYLIAEATRSVSLNDPSVYDKSNPAEKVYLGSRILDVQWGVCPHTIQVFTALDDRYDVSTDLVVANKTCYVMNDLSAIEAYKNRPYVAGWPHMRFYAEVPIHSPTGFVIGTYCVVDNKPRDGLDKNCFDALNEIAAAIMNHLTLIRKQQDLQRAGEMVIGLNKFVDGKNGSQEFWDGAIVGQVQNRPPINRTGTAQTVSAMSSSPQEVPQPSTSPSGHQAQQSTLAKENGSESSLQSKPVTEYSLHPRERKLSLSDASSEEPESIASLETKLLFARASGLIREALKLDGMIFIDACFRDITVMDPLSSASAQGSNSGGPSPDQRFRGVPDIPDTSKTEWLSDPAPTFTDFTSNTEPSFLSSDLSDDRPTSMSDLLGKSLGENITLGGSTASTQQVALSQSTLRGILRMHRKGKIFEYDEDGNPLNVVDDMVKTRIQKFNSTRENMYMQQLWTVCHGARSILLLPLWDPHKEQWFSIAMAWTTNQTNILGPEDMTYLTAFGSCIMAEKSRLDALYADRAKADFISSVSHELRSPLHGVLASAEALQDISTGFAQDDMIRTIRVCGEVLLETMDQILDYAKTSHSNPKVEIASKEVLQSNKVPNIDLATIVETVVEGIFAGHKYRNSIDECGHESMANFRLASGDLVIILSISWQASWVFESQLGGWKRILMNLFGNALKYTSSGFVHVTLSAKPEPVTKLRKPRTIVTLQIDDSGRGMSKEYMKYKLYTPFSQEDTHANGTGLGLSIVRQLVTDFGGRIDIRSEKGCGTSVKVTAPLVQSSELPDIQYLESSAVVADVGRRSKGLTLCLVGFEYYPEMGQTPNGVLSTQAKRMLAIKSTLIALAVDWFGMTTTNATSIKSANGDIIMTLCSVYDKAGDTSNSRPLIAFQDIVSNHIQLGSGAFTLSQPVGPHKFARILAHCLDHITFSAKSKVEQLASKTLRELGASEYESHTSLVGKLSRVSEIPVQVIRKVEIQIAETIQSQPMGSLDELQVNREGHESKNLGFRSVRARSESDSIPQLVTNMSISEIQTSRRSKALLVEDNSINMKILVNYMKRSNTEYLTAENGLEALQHYVTSPHVFKIVFMDISMPVMDGLVSTQKIRQFEKENSLSRTRIVALTCFSSPEYQRDALFSGIDMFLIKPVPMKTLQPLLDLDPENVKSP